MKYQIAAMLQSGGGTIVNMASLAGVTGVANLAAYVAGKAGVIGLTKVAALDYADRASGSTWSHPARSSPITWRRPAPAQRQAALAAPMRRTGTAAEVASVCCGCPRPAPRTSPGR